MASEFKGVSNRLEQLASRLVNVTRANKSIRLLRKTKQQCFDVAEAHPLRGGVAADLLKKVLHGKQCVLLSHRDSPVDPRDDRYELMIDEKNALEEVETAEFRLVRLFRKLDSNLTQLSRKANLIEAETGASDLYVGYPWLTGNCDDTEGTFLQAPLMLFPVRLTAQRTPQLQWLVEPRKDAEPIFNEALGLALEQFHHTKLSEEFIEEAETEAESEAVADDPSRLLRWFQERFAALGIRLTDSDEQVRVLQEFKAEGVPRATAAFTIRAHVIVGYFPQADSSLRRDYEALIPLADQGQLGDVLARLMDSSAPAPVGDGKAKQSMDEVPEGETCWIVDSDASQEAAMLRSRTEPCLVVHGPPGTGKSQVICNLITDALSKGQRVLVCCQKRAALDVVYQRLESAGLGANVAVVHDHSNDRQALYERIAKALEPELVEGVDTPDQVQKLARTIDETTQVLKQVAEELFKPRRCGATARDLYAMALGVREDIDPELSRVAGRFQLDGLDKFLGTLQRLREFHARLGDRASTWTGRKSFARLTFADRARIEAALKRVAEATQTLLRAESAIGANRLNASQIAPHVELMTGLGAVVDTQADDYTLALAGVLLDGSKAGAARAALEASQKLLEPLRSLPPRPGANFLGGPIEVAVALETYNAKRRSLFRVFSSAYRAAKRSTQAYLTREAAPDTPEVVSDQAALIRSQNLWARVERAVEGTALSSLLASVRDPGELARCLSTAQAASQLASKFRDAATSLGALHVHLNALGISIREAADRANRLSALGVAYRATKLAIDTLEPFLREESRSVLAEKADRNAADLLGLVERLREGLNDFDTLQAMDDAIEELNEIEAKVYRHVRKHGPQLDWSKHVRDALLNGWLAEVEQESRALRRVSSGEVLDLRQQFRANLARRRELNRKRLALQLQGRCKGRLKSAAGGGRKVQHPLPV